MKRFLFLTVWYVFLPALLLFNRCEAEDAHFGKGSAPGEKKTLTVDGVDFTFCWCPPGEFAMGSPSAENGRDDPEKQHDVRLTEGFWLLESEVTQKMWKCVMGTTIEDMIKQEEEVTKHEIARPDPKCIGPEKPMWRLSWLDCQAFCKKLSSMTGRKVVLPTEAQWEYACRAGSEGAYAGTGGLETMGWYHENSGGYLHDVKGKRPNAWGLYDMHGNVWEWCSDWYGEKYYRESPVDNPAGPSDGPYRVLRGGSWRSFARFCRSAYRRHRGPWDRDGVWDWDVLGHGSGLGFRPALISAED